MENEHKTFSTRKDASSTSIPRGIVHFPRWFWYSVLSFVLLVSMVHFLSFISRILRRSSSQKSLNVPCSEADTMGDNLSSATKEIINQRCSVLLMLCLVAFAMPHFAGPYIFQSRDASILLRLYWLQYTCSWRCCGHIYRLKVLPPTPLFLPCIKIPSPTPFKLL